MGRRIKYLAVILGLGLGLSPGAANCQDLFTILRLALDNDPTLKQAEATYRSNRELMIQSRSSLLPTLGANARSSRLTSGPSDETIRETRNPNTGEVTIFRTPAHSFRPGLNNHGWGVSLNQSVLNLANWYTFQSARASNRAGQVNLAAQEQDLIMRVATAYFDVLRAQELLETNLQEEAAAQRELDQTRQREEVGLVAITDVYDSQAAYDLAVNTTILQRDLLQASFEALEAITGQAHSDIEELREDFPALEVDGALSEWEQQARDSSLAIAAAEFTLDASRKTLRARRSDHLPTIALSGQFAHDVTAPIVNQGIQIGGGAFDRTALTLSVQVPLFQGGTLNSRRRQAEYDVIAAEESLELTRRQLTQNIRNAYRRVNTDVLVIAQRQQSIISSQTALEATELGAEVGTRNIVEVLLARQNLYRALRDYADARFNYVLDSLMLKQVAGILTPQDVVELNQWLVSAE